PLTAPAARRPRPTPAATRCRSASASRTSLTRVNIQPASERSRANIKTTGIHSDPAEVCIGSIPSPARLVIMLADRRSEQVAVPGEVVPRRPVRSHAVDAEHLRQRWVRALERGRSGPQLLAGSDRPEQVADAFHDGVLAGRA